MEYLYDTANYYIPNDQCLTIKSCMSKIANKIQNCQWFVILVLEVHLNDFSFHIKTNL